MKTWMLGAALLATAAALGTVPAEAAEFGFHARGPVVYVPPCPGPGYAWVDGYTANGYWVPGRWELRAAPRWDRDHFARFDYGRGERRAYDRGYERGFERGRR